MFELNEGQKIIHIPDRIGERCGEYVREDAPHVAEREALHLVNEEGYAICKGCAADWRDTLEVVGRGLLQKKA